MAVTLATLRTAHPEFVDSPDAVVQAAIDDATLHTESTIFSAAAAHDSAITWYACYLISTSPYNRDKRRRVDLGIPEGYLSEYERIARASARAHRWMTGQ